MIGKLQERIRLLAEADPMGYWYQPVEFDSITAPTKPDQHPASFGRGKWDNYVKPQMVKPFDTGNGYFCEMGCNAGLYLVMAHEAGFRRTWGVEGANAAWGQLQLTAEYHDELDMHPVFAKLGTVEGAIADSVAPDFDLEKQPIVDCTLMAQFLYWVTPGVAQHYVDALSEKSVWCVVLTNRASRQRSPGDPNSVIEMFKRNWHLTRAIPTTKRDGRRQITSLLFRSKWLHALPTGPLFDMVRGANPANEVFYGSVFPGFVSNAIDRTPMVYDNCATYNWLLNGEHGSTAYNHKVSSRAVDRWRWMSRDIQRSGQLVPIMLKPPGTDKVDGNHRVAMCHYLGIPRVYCVNQGKRANVPAIERY